MASLYFYREPSLEPPPEKDSPLGACHWCGEQIWDAAVESPEGLKLCPECFRSWLGDETDAQLADMLGWSREVLV
jgi:formylmethanofuran dehydrogenase subunit E